MSNYRARSDGRYPITLQELRRMVDIAFGTEPTQDVLDAAGVDLVVTLDRPDIDPAAQSVREGDPELLDGAWQQTWIVEELPAPPPPPVPQLISDRQFAEQLALEEEITRDEAEEWTGAGVIPARLLAAVEEIPDEDTRWIARMHLRGARDFLRDNVFTLTLASIMAWSDEAVDRIWREAAQR